MQVQVNAQDTVFTLYSFVHHAGLLKRCLHQAICVLVMLLTIITADAVGATADRFAFRTIDARDGLVQNTIIDLLQDQHGFVWIATQGGLHRYDGYQFQVFQHDPSSKNSLPDSLISALAQDRRRQCMMVGTDGGGIAEIHIDGSVRRLEIAGLPSNITALLEVDGVGLWIGSRTGLQLLDRAGKLSTWLSFSEEAPNRVLGMLADADGSLWVSTEKAGMYRLQQQQLVSIPTELSDALFGAARPQSAPIVSMAMSTEGDLVFAQAQRLTWLNRDRNNVERQRPITGIRAMTFAADRSLWLARGADGLAQLSVSEQLDPPLAISNILQSDVAQSDVQVTRLMLDQSGQLWAGTQSSGLRLTDTAGIPFRALPVGSGDAARNIRSLAQAQQYLWAATLNGEVLQYRYQADSINLLRTEQPNLLSTSLRAAVDQALGSSNYRTHALLHTSLASKPANANLMPTGQPPTGQPPTGQLWVTTSIGVAILDLANNTARRLDAVGPDDQIRVLIQADDGSIWAGGNVGLLHFDVNGNALDDQTFLRGLIRNTMVLALLEDSQNRLWVGTRHGLWVRSNHWQQFRADESNPRALTGDIVRSIVQTKDGTIWIGTHSGLARLDQLDEKGVKFSRYTVRDGLPSPTVYCILEDQIGQLWLSGNRGLMSFLPRTNQWRAFDQQEGLNNLEFNGGACVQLPDGMLSFGGVNGITVFAPELADRSEFNAPVRLLGVRVGATRSLQSIRGNRITVPYASRVVDLQFAALDFRAPTRNGYAYKLDGFDGDWVFGRGLGRATYTNLSPGRYTLRVRGSNRDDRWSTQELAIELIVKPPFWRMPSVQFACAAAATTVLAWVLWNRRKRKRHERALVRQVAEREDRLRLSLWGSGDLYWDYHHGSKVLRRASAEATLGIIDDGSYDINQYLRDQVHPEDVPTIITALAQANAGATSEINFQHRLKNVAGGWTWVAARGQVVERDSKGKVIKLAGTAHSIEKNRAAELESRISARVLERMSEAVAISTDDGRVLKVNAAFEQITGFRDSDIIGQSRAKIQSQRHDAQQYRAVEQIVQSEGRWKGEMWMRRADGVDFLASVEINRVEGLTGEQPVWVTVLSDITDRKLAEEELRFLANFDSLTGLPNRSMLLQRLQRAISRAKRHEQRVALLFIDLDRFKQINDSLGHAAGDELLRGVADRLRAVVREIDTTARLAGDEFVLLIEELSTPKDAMTSAHRVLERFIEPFSIQGSDVLISPSIGVALFPDDAETPDELIKCGDLAMYEAKAEGRNTIRKYSSKQSEVAVERAATESLLKRAMDREQFELYYQPAIDLQTNQPGMIEALLRWRHPTRGVVAPDVFVPILEESGLIVPIGLWVLNQALQQLKRWDDIGLSGLSVSVNVSMLQLSRSDLVQELSILLDRYQIARGRLTLELTESLVMANPEQSIAVLNQISELGVQLAIDDFGTGYSSLSYLRRLPIDKLKIDKSFIRDLTTDADGHAIAASIIAIAKTLQLRVTAEGVETLEQLQALQRLHCDEAQGFYFAKPMDAASCTTALQDRRATGPAAQSAT